MESVKKTTLYAERNIMERAHYIYDLDALEIQYGVENIIYFDESSFAAHTYRPHGWAPKGQKIYEDIRGKREKRTNLIMAQRGKDWLAPMLFQGSCTARTVTHWIKYCLLLEIEKPSVIVMDNAPIHNKKQIKALLEENGHVLLCLPRYSPDFNPIECSFGVLKKRRQFIPKESEIDTLFLSESKLE